MIKSPLNYAGGKYRLLPQLLPLFPKYIGTFHDVFCGGANVSVNVAHLSKRVIASDINPHTIALFNHFKKTGSQKVHEELQAVTNYYQLSESNVNGYAYYGCQTSTGLSTYNKEPFLRLREAYNLGKHPNFSKEIMFFALVIFGFNNQIRFSKNGFNMPVGKRDFNKNMQTNLFNFCNALSQNDIQFLCEDYSHREFSENDFVYADPPYLISTATYNEQNGWSEKEELRLLKFLKDISRRNIKFALSNVVEHHGKKNNILLRWIKDNDFTMHELNFHYDNSNYQKKITGMTKEVLITNY